MICFENKPFYYEKKLFKKTYYVCKDCSKQARETGTANTLVNKWFSEEDLAEGATKAKKKISLMSDRKKNKLVKRLKKFGYDEEQIEEALKKIQGGK